MFIKWVRGVILGASVAVASVVSVAGNTPTVSPMLQQTVEKLTTEERAYVKQQLSDTKEVQSTAGKVGEWAELGARVGVGIAAAAKELGIAAAEFSQTPIGKVVVAVLVFKVIGKTVILVVVGLTLLFVTVPLGMKFIRKQKIPTGEYTKQNIFGWTRDVPTYRYVEHEDYQILFGWVVAIVGVFFGMLCIASV